AVQIGLRRAAEEIDSASEVALESTPKVVGLATDPSFAIRGTIKAGGSAVQTGLNIGADVSEAAENFLDATKDTIDLATELSLAIASSEFETLQRVKEIEARLREEPGKRLEVFNQREALVQAMGRYRS